MMEIGIMHTLGLDSRFLTTLETGYGPRLKRFPVQFTGKPGITVGYSKDVPHAGNFAGMGASRITRS
jgi:exodeoxyribonuclease V alpha subunit